MAQADIPERAWHRVVKPSEDTDILYCYACLQWHASGEHRQIVKLPFRIGVWTVKAYWQTMRVVSFFMAAVVFLMFFWIAVSIGYEMLKQLLH